MRSFKFLFFLLILIAVAGMNWYCGSSEKTSTVRTTYAGLTDSAKYVGIQTCKGCHANVHATFIHTGMGQSFDHATKIKSSANFEVSLQKLETLVNQFFLHADKRVDKNTGLDISSQVLDAFISKLKSYIKEMISDLSKNYSDTSSLN